jgi:hypothetical protein
VFSNDIVWNDVFHRHFTKVRIIEQPDEEELKVHEKNTLGKKRKRFINAAKRAKNVDFSSYTPAREDSYNVIICGLLEYMPVETAIKDIYGPNQDLF